MDESFEVVEHRPGRCRASEAVVTAVADATGTSPLALDAPLASVVDPDALDVLFTDPAVDLRLGLSFAGCAVTVGPDGHVRARPADDA